MNLKLKMRKVPSFAFAYKGLPVRCRSLDTLANRIKAHQSTAWPAANEILCLS